MGKCYRCDRVHISGEYKAKSSKAVIPSERRKHVYIDFATTDGLQEFPLDLFDKIDDLTDAIGKMKM